MRVALASVVWLAACYNEAAVTPCTLTCDDNTPCPGDLECGSDHFCQTPGMPLCSMTPNVGSGIYIKATIARAGNRFGSAVALSADGVTLAVGAPQESYGAYSHAGAVYVYSWDGTQYSYEKRLISPAPDDDDGFGTSVSLSADGNVLAVGVPGEDSGAGGINGDSADNTAPDSGAVFQFVRNPGWMQQRYIKSATQTNWGFGTAVALTANGMGLAITAPGAGNTTERVTRITLGTGTTTGVSASPMCDVDDGVGSSVAILDDASSVFVGASLDDEDATGFTTSVTAPSQGAQDAGAMWGLGYSASYRYNFKASNTDAGDQFGTSVACTSDGTTALAGAPREDSDGDQPDNTKDASGAVYVFNDATLASAHQVAYLKAPMPAAGDLFGASISLAADGTRLVSGAPGRAGGGAAFVFDGDGKTVWMPGAQLVGLNTEAGDEFGASVAVSRNHFVIAVGAPGEASEITVANAPGDPKNNNAPGAGAVYVFG